MKHESKHSNNQTLKRSNIVNVQMKTEQRIQLLHPHGKYAPSVSADTYYLFEKAITEILQQKEQIAFYDLVEEIRKYFKKNKIKFEGAVDWFGISVKNHLEAKGLIESFTEKGKKLNRLKNKV
jgi:hypothetical protein